MVQGEQNSKLQELSRQPLYQVGILSIQVKFDLDLGACIKVDPRWMIEKLCQIAYTGMDSFFSDANLSDCWKETY